MEYLKIEAMGGENIRIQEPMSCSKHVRIELNLNELLICQKKSI